MIMAPLSQSFRKLLPPTASSSAFSAFLPNRNLDLPPAFRSWMLVFTSALYRTSRRFHCSFCCCCCSSQCLPSNFTSNFTPIVLAPKSSIRLGFYAPPSCSFPPLLNFIFFFKFIEVFGTWLVKLSSILSLALIRGTSVSKIWFIWRLALHSVLTCLILALSSFHLSNPVLWTYIS